MGGEGEDYSLNLDSILQSVNLRSSVFTKHPHPLLVHNALIVTTKQGSMIAKRTDHYTIYVIIMLMTIFNVPSPNKKPFRNACILVNTKDNLQLCTKYISLKT